MSKKILTLIIAIGFLWIGKANAQCNADFDRNPNTVCIGEPVVFFDLSTGGSNPKTWSWNFGPGATPATFNGQNPPTVTYSTIGTKTTTLTYTTNSGGCSDVKQRDVQVVTQPTITFTSNSPQCVGQQFNFTYTGSAALTYYWDFGIGANPSSSSIQNPQGITYTSSGTKIVTLIIDNGTCTASTTQNITVSPTPTVSFASTAPKCTGIVVDFTNTGTSSGVTYSWNFGNGATPSTSISQNPTGVIYSTSGTKIITLSITNSTSGCSVDSTGTININETPISSFTSNAPKCENSLVSFTNSGTTGIGVSYLWDFGSGAIPATSTAQNPFAEYTGGGNKTVTLIVTNQFQCSATSTSTITINSLPVADAGVDTTICPNTTVQIGASSDTNNTYSWFPSNSLVISNPTISNPVAMPVASITNYVITVTDTATNCVNVDTAIVTMLLPIVADAGIDVEICRYDSIQLGVGAIENQHYVWTPVNGLTGSMMSNPMVSPDSSITYTVTVINEYDCPSASDNVTVIVHQLPLIYAGMDDSITVGSSTQLIATGGIQYNWTPIYGLDNSGVYNPIAGPDTTINYTVKGIDIYGCINFDTILVTVLAPEIWIPNAFTPDDIYNNVLYVRGQGVENFQFRIFDRDGALIFYSQNMDQGWDGGQQLTHEKLPQGAYVYDVQGVLTDGNALHESGIINLIR